MKRLSNKRTEEVFKVFLAEYLENVQKELPTSYRAQQLKAGGTEAALVYEFESRFLKGPFLKAIRNVYTLETIESIEKKLTK